MENGRLKIIWKLFSIYGLSIINKGWKMNLRAFSVISFMTIMYVNDLRDVIETMLNGNFILSENVVSLTSLQIQSIITYRLYLLLTRKDEMIKLVRSVSEEFPEWIERDDLRKSIIKSSKRGTSICWIYTAQLITNTILFPALTISQSKEPNVPLPTDSSSTFQAKIFFRVCYIVLAISITVAWNLLLFTLIMTVCAHLEHLAVEMEPEHAEPELTACAIRNFVDRYNRIREWAIFRNQKVKMIIFDT